MTSRPGIRLSRLGLIARLAATAAVAVGAMLAALVPAASAAATGHRAEATPPAGSAAQNRAQRLLDDFAVPPGAVLLPAEPSDGLAAAQLPALPPSDRRAAGAFWRVPLSINALMAWFDQHPEEGLVRISADAQDGRSGTVTFHGAPSADAPAGIDVTASGSELADGSTLLRVTVVIGYVAARPTTEALPRAAELIVVPTFPLGSNQNAPQLTVTDPARIARIEQIIDRLPKAPTGLTHCPFDNGAGLALDFESAQNTTLADAVLGVAGCQRVQVSISGYNEPALTGGSQAVAQIQAVLGTRWPLA